MLTVPPRLHGHPTKSKSMPRTKTSLHMQKPDVLSLHQHRVHRVKARLSFECGDKPRCPRGRGPPQNNYFEVKRAKAEGLFWGGPRGNPRPCPGNKSRSLRRTVCGWQPQQLNPWLTWKLYYRLLDWLWISRRQGKPCENNTVF